ncbi:GFA family protein [Marinobacter fonticola]|uniref:GFA family protein n=1 Tax=Marinobacter fonticola TaxID=2603215 RepID=UPI0011E69BD8|nr:GFA family protein [Marinobacter fonticola]
MKLEGSCHCGAVRFFVESIHPYPFMQCYCTICRKTAGGGGYAINLSADYGTLHIYGQENINIYHARISDAENGTMEESPAARHFCKNCGSALWLWDPRWPELVHPMASAIDTPLPQPPERTHLMIGSKPDWVKVDAGENDKVFEGYPDESLADWHQRLGLEDPQGLTTNHD